MTWHRVGDDVAGLKETAIALSDPFGMDAVDFETDVFMARIMINTKELISRQANYVPQPMPLPPMTFYGEEIESGPPEA